MHEPMRALVRGPGRVLRASASSATIVFYDDDPTSTVSVHRAAAAATSGPTAAIVVNGKSDGSLFGDYTTMALAALVPALLRRRTPSAAS